MTRNSETLIRDVMDFWFGPHGHPERGTVRKIWFEPSAQFDDEIRRRFHDDVIEAGRGELDGLSATAEGVLTLLVLLDQFPRNLFRDTPRAFVYDPKARAVARLAISMGLDVLLSPVERIFIYMPYEHSEDIEDQRRSVTLFNSLPSVPWRDYVIDFAIRHHDVIARYGRFPHRNAILGRASTEDELDFLRREGRGF